MNRNKIKKKRSELLVLFLFLFDYLYWALVLSRQCVRFYCLLTAVVQTDGNVKREQQKTHKIEN